MDPDRWFTPDPTLKQSLRDELEDCIDDKIEFLSVLLVASKKMSVSHKHEAAITYMEERVSISSNWRKSFLETLKKFGDAQNHYREQPLSDVAKKEFEKMQEALRVAVNTFTFPDKQTTKVRQQTNEIVPKATDGMKIRWLFNIIVHGLGYLTNYVPSKPWIKIPVQAEQSAVSKSADAEINSTTSKTDSTDSHSTDSHSTDSHSTDYYFQILADESVEKVFGPVFAGLIRALKTPLPFIVRPRECLPASGLPAPISSSASGDNGDTQADEDKTGESDDGSEDIGLGTLFDP